LICEIYIQGGNFNWNKIHNLEIGNFCQKSRNRSIFIFLCPHFDAYGFCLPAPGSVQPPQFFFSNGRVCQVTPRLKDHFARNTMHYLFPRYSLQTGLSNEVSLDIPLRLKKKIGGGCALPGADMQKPYASKYGQGKIKIYLFRYFYKNRLFPSYEFYSS
jgi:hypothetical protein